MGTTIRDIENADPLFRGSGEMRARCRAFDWSTTPLGPSERWPLSLRTIVGALLASRHPMFLWWGPDLIQIYNDAYRPSFAEGGRHLRALGTRGEDCWTEIWPAIFPQIQQVMAGGESTWHEDQYLPIERNGRLEDVWWTYSYGPAFDDTGAVGGVLVVCQETTSRVRAEQRLSAINEELEGLLVDARAARADAERANRAKSDFLAVMSHELRTPLNAIGGYAELLDLGVRGPVNAEQRLDLARIQKSQRHLLGLINDVLNYARIEASAIRYAVDDVRVDETIAACEALTAPQRRAKGLTFALTGNDQVVAVCADAEKVQQILLNLFTNAIKFTITGGIEVTCEGRSDTVVVTVADTGPGIAGDYLDRIFDPFVQVDAGLTRTGDGVGLGLAISRDLARGMHGDLTAQSTPGLGSQFSLTLPRADRTPAEV